MASVSHYWGWIAHSPVKQATAPSAGSAGVSPPDAQVVARLLEVARDEDPELGLFLRLAVVLGARRGELCGLKWRDVDLDNGEVFIVLPKTERLIRLISRWTSKSRTIGRSGG